MNIGPLGDALAITVLQKVSPKEPLMIIDCHTHIFPKKMIEDRQTFLRRDEGFSSLYSQSKAKMMEAEDLIASMDEAGIEWSVVCGFSWNDPDLCSFHNQYLLESASKFPKRLMVYVALPFSNPDWSWKELDRAIKGGARGVGEIAFYHEAMTSNDLLTIKPLLSQMEKKGIPLLLHTNETVGHYYPGKGKTPLERFYELILSYPKLPIILGHWGGGLPFYELMPEVARTMGNVYYDTAASPFLYSKKIYTIVRQIVGVERILFGSDFPLISPKRYFRELEDSGLSKQDQKKILGLNFFKAFLKKDL